MHKWPSFKSSLKRGHGWFSRKKHLCSFTHIYRIKPSPSRDKRWARKKNGISLTTIRTKNRKAINRSQSLMKWFNERHNHSNDMTNSNKWMIYRTLCAIQINIVNSLMTQNCVLTQTKIELWAHSTQSRWWASSFFWPTSVYTFFK